MAISKYLEIDNRLRARRLATFRRKIHFPENADSEGGKAPEKEEPAGVNRRVVKKSDLDFGGRVTFSARSSSVPC